REIHVLLDTLKADPRCDGRLGMVGMCLSGGFVIQMARRPDMAAPVLYHHSLGQEGAGVPDDEPLDDVVRLQAHFARRDVFCPPRRRRRLEERLEGRIDAFTYDLPHGFRSVARSTEGAALAWERTLRFFDEHLRT
ncbi:MAG: dienelactone hydrolase family protein, partial [Myxococcota bacterium]